MKLSEKKSTQPDEKACLNCQWFLRHYIKEEMRFKKVFCGNCAHNRTKRIHKKEPFTACALWEPETIKPEGKKSVKEFIENISKKLDDIATVLMDDEEKE